MDEYRLVSVRLELVLLNNDFLYAMKVGDRHFAARIGGFTIPDDLMLSQLLLASFATFPWSSTPGYCVLLSLENRRRCVGQINFHLCPGPDDLREIAADGMELGYSAGEAIRRQG